MDFAFKTIHSQSQVVGEEWEGRKIGLKINDREYNTKESMPLKKH